MLQRQPAFPFALLFIWASASGVAILRVSSCAILFYSPLNIPGSPCVTCGKTFHLMRRIAEQGSRDSQDFYHLHEVL
ncbi:hypothetical protein DTO013E5_9052 [Penicillium roqueforti]|uniref:uncharacterized protein n=1 Tax=Penicillium roqueforti TaxID=5082 RepID=UPI00190E2066|nr:uncharacterized protein LCP9604111_7186 [Penicillium roqueforti]KAF9244794.1 hypothetical protein LCP9604111_7186 [Penicillium roqueforti]KAI1831186.1 hypothetical protein CBS147337_7944 [Penicillium roqueforti]KAI2680931.1 hypothetical protein LCP963914a_6882 [Penicillium roqueforti]KAI2690584.1 hypothetical protein CBS147355_1035 [Penicillium roqueforti]KAI2698153.1 hypothetical protein CBS147372_7171 [Penicillium roqueforti]